MNLFGSRGRKDDAADRARQLTDLERAARAVAAHHAGVDPYRQHNWTAIAEWARDLQGREHDPEELKELARNLPTPRLPSPRSELELDAWQLELVELLRPVGRALDELRATGRS